MTWDNWGNDEGDWSIDHILPCALFDLTDAAQQHTCFHHSNLQPLWHIENVMKNDKLEDGRRAGMLTQDEKRLYLIERGFGHLFKG